MEVNILMNESAVFLVSESEAARRSVQAVGMTPTRRIWTSLLSMAGGTGQERCLRMS